MNHHERKAVPVGSLSLWVERSCLALGALALVTVALVYADAWYASTRAVAAFERALERRAAPEASPQLAGRAVLPPEALPGSAATPSTPSARLQAGTDALPVALLRAPRLGLEVPVFVGTDLRTLNRGVGLVEGTAPPDTTGNTVISGHRDSFFRPLKDLEPGDELDLVLPTGVEQRFEVEQIFVTDPLDVSVLEPTAVRRLTLITCYPFAYVGFAPERLIVRAGPADPARG
jgi:LPXTG-site transpeptidase (sortase) family protein